MNALSSGIIPGEGVGGGGIMSIPPIKSETFNPIICKKWTCTTPKMEESTSEMLL